MKTRTAFISLAIALVWSGSANAQSYYVRERIAGLPATTSAPTPTPTPTPAQAAWQTGSWSAWSSTCSDSATRTRSVSCISAGSTVADSNCVAAKPISSETSPQLSTCSYTPSYGVYGACTGGFKTAAISRCTRSDLTDVDVSLCGADKQVSQVACTNCNDPVAGMASSGPRIVNLSTATTAAAAGDQCRAHVTANPGVSGICIWDRTNNNVSINSGSYISTNGPYWGSACSR